MSCGRRARILSLMACSLLLAAIVLDGTEWLTSVHWEADLRLTSRDALSVLQTRAPACLYPPGLCKFQPNSTFDLFRQGPFRFLPSYRNPCWQEPFGNRLACLPFFFVAGFPKCGTTDLYARITMHQRVVSTTLKEPHWVTRERYKGQDFDYYTSFFAGPLLSVRRNESEVTYNPYVAGDGSASTLWDNDFWCMFPGNENCLEPRIIHADYIRHLVPEAKIVVVLREPVSRLYSDYMYFGLDPSKEEFHSLVVKQLHNLQKCFDSYSIRHCLYNGSLNNFVRVRLGIYHVFLEDWFLRFPGSQIHVIRLEDLKVNVTRQLLKIYSFLDLDDPSSKTRQQILETPPLNTGSVSLQQGPMLNHTRHLLEDFYRPFNHRLAALLKDDSYLWKY